MLFGFDWEAARVLDQQLTPLDSLEDLDLIFRVIFIVGAFCICRHVIQ